MGSAKQLFVHDDGVILQKVSVQTLNPKRCGIHIAAVTFTIIIANIEEVDGLVEKNCAGWRRDSAQNIFDVNPKP